MILKFKDVLPNPYRDLTFNPLNPDKVNELVDSINETGFWDNVVVRIPDKKAECAYGHTRIAAAIKAGLTEANFIVKDFDDEMMIKVMGRENSDTYKYCILALLEKVRAVVVGLAEGKVKPFVINEKTPESAICYAPSFIPEASDSKLLSHRYTAVNVAKFLGMTSERTDGRLAPDNDIIAALGALRLIQNNLLSYEEVKEWTVNELLKAVRERTERHTAVLKHEANKAEIVKQASLTTQQQIDIEKTKKAERRAAQQLLDKQHAKESEAAREAEVQRRIAKKKQDAIDAAEREKARKIAERLYESEREAIAKSAKALQYVEEQRLKKEEAARASLAKLNRENTERVLSPADPLFESLKKEGRDPRTTDKERSQQIEALDDIIGRVEQAKKLMRPEPAKKETK